MSDKIAANAFAMPPLPAIGGFRIFQAAANMQAEAYKAVLRYQVEALGFVRRRYEQDIKLIDDLIEAEELNDAFEVMSDFVENAASEYAREAGKFATIGSSVASEAAKRMRKDAESGLADMAARTAAA